MDISIPAERQISEYRVGLTPEGARLLSQAGHRVFVERGAGQGAGYSDADYEAAGARTVYNAQEVYQRADLVLKVAAPTPDELDELRDGQTICAFWHLAVRPRPVLATLLERNISAVAYETIQREDGILPVLQPLSEIAGRMAPQVAARWLQNDGGGRGILLSGIAGVPPPEVVILGAGGVGYNAARVFYNLGARVLVLDKSLEKLQAVDRHFDGRIATMVAHQSNVERVVRFANVLVGAVLVAGARAPILVTHKMVQTMQPQSVILDVSIDQGGCVETSRPTTHANPVFVEDNVIHYCVPNMPSLVARTATRAYLDAAWPYIWFLAGRGTEEAMELNAEIRRGVAVHNGQVLNPALAGLLEEA